MRFAQGCIMTLNCRSYPRRDERKGTRKIVAESYPIHAWTQHVYDPDDERKKSFRGDFPGRNANDLGHWSIGRRKDGRSAATERRWRLGKKGPERIRTWKGKGERVRGSGRKLKSGGPRSH